jgi:hypothetical protein
MHYLICAVTKEKREWPASAQPLLIESSECVYIFKVTPETLPTAYEKLVGWKRVALNLFDYIGRQDDVIEATLKLKKMEE